MLHFLLDFANLLHLLFRRHLLIHYLSFEGCMIVPERFSWVLNKTIECVAFFQLLIKIHVHLHFSIEPVQFGRLTRVSEELVALQILSNRLTAVF